MADKETRLDRPLSGLFLMTALTAVWTILAEYYFNNLDFRIISIAFGSIIIYFIYSYWTFFKKKTSLH